MRGSAADVSAFVKCVMVSVILILIMVIVTWGYCLLSIYYMPGTMPRASPASPHRWHLHNDPRSISLLGKLRLGTLHRVSQSGGGRVLGLRGNFSRLPFSVWKTNRPRHAHCSNSVFILSSPTSSPHPSSCPRSHTPFSRCLV